MLRNKAPDSRFDEVVTLGASQPGSKTSCARYEPTLSVLSRAVPRMPAPVMMAAMGAAAAPDRVGQAGEQAGAELAGIGRLGVTVESVCGRC